MNTTHPKSTTFSTESRIAAFIGIVLFIYLILRSVYTPILHDEVATFFYYIQTGVFFPPEAHWDANNHILNSLLSHWSYLVFGSETWALRLPNVLSYPLYVWSSWKIASEIPVQFRIGKWSLFLSLIMAHYMFEYFGEVRGYGMSMAFLLFGIYALRNYIKRQTALWLATTLFAFFLATAANLTLIYSSVLILIPILIVIVRLKAVIQIKLGHFVLVLVTIALFSPLVNFAFELKNRGALYYGGKSGFWDYTGNTLSELFFGYYSTAIAGVLILLTLVIAFVFLFDWWKQKYTLPELITLPQFIWVYLLIGSVFAIFGTRYILDVNFPEDRAAMYLYPYFIASLIFTIGLSSSALPKTLRILIVCLPLYVPVHFLFSVNLYTASFSMEERAPQDFFDYISSQENTSEYPLTVGGYVTQELCWFYMNQQQGGKQGRLLYSNHIDTLCDFQIVDQKRELPPGFLNSYKKVNAIPINNLNLYERTQTLRKEKITDTTGITNWVHNDNEFFEFIQFPIPDSLRGKPLYIGVQSVLDVKSAPSYMSLTVSQKRPDQSEVIQEPLRLDWLKKEWKDSDGAFSQSFVIPRIDEETDYLVLYLWNQKKKEFLVHSGKVEIFVLEAE